MGKQQAIPGIANIKSSLALKQVQYRTALPLDHIVEDDHRRVAAEKFRQTFTPRRYSKPQTRAAFVATRCVDPH